VSVRPSDYENLSYLAERIAYLTEAQYGLGHPQSASNNRALAQAHFRAIHQIALTKQAPDPELVMNADDFGYRLNPDRRVVNHLLAGEAALKRAVESWQENPDATDLQLAEAVAQVGDWNLAFEYYRSAEINYEQAYRILAASADFATLADRYMGQPAPIRFMNTEQSFVRDPNPPAVPGSLEISMTVMDNGRLQDVEITDAPENLSEEQSQKILGVLQGALFRPAVINGEVRILEDFVWKITPLSSNTAKTASPG
jgi:hypothetical protein